MRKKKVVKAHEGFAHVPKTGGQPTPTKPPTKGRGRPPTGGRMIGLPQQFKGGGRRPNTQEQNLPAWAKKTLGGRRPTQAPKISPKVAQPIPQDSPMKQPKAPTTGNPFPKGSHNYEVYEGRGGRPVPPTIYKPPTQTPPKQAIQQVVAPRVPRGLRAVSKPISRNQGFLKNLNRQTDTFKNKQNTAINKFNKSQRNAMNTFRTVNKGGYISRAKYGIVDNLKEGKK